MMIELLKIDPYLEAVYPVSVSQTLTDICRQLGARRLTIAGRQPLPSTDLADTCADAAYCDEEALQRELIPPAFRIRSTGHVIYGCALWHRATEAGELQPPAWSLSELTRQIEFLGFQPPPARLSDSLLFDDESIPLDE